MAECELAETVAPCGLVCGVCRNATPEKGGCAGCHRGGGPADCHQRICCAARHLDGCWQCQDFPCEEGFFADNAWKGLCVGSIEAIRRHGTQRFVELLVSRLGPVVEYGDYRSSDPQDILTAFCGTTEDD